MRSRKGKVLLIVLILLLIINSYSIIVRADGGTELTGNLKIGIVKNVVGDVIISHEIRELMTGELISEEEKQLQSGDIIYSNSIITTGSNSQLTMEIFQSAWDEKIKGSIILEENTVIKVAMEVSPYNLETGKIKVYLNGRSGERFDFDSMEVIVEKGQEVEFEMQASKKGGN